MATGHRALRICIALGLVAAMVWGAVMLVQSDKAYRQESEMHQSVLGLRPSAAIGNATPVAPAGDYLAQLQARNPHIVGWVHLPGTPIDYPFVQTENNSDYLRHDLDGNEALAGSVFMDYRCNAAAPGSNTILYGHNMQNNSMFGALPALAEDEFFAQHREGELFLNGQWYNFTLFACLEVAPDDAFVYAEIPAQNGGMNAYLEYIRRQASQFQPPQGVEDKPLITLSTCSAISGQTHIVAVGVIAPAA